MVLQAETVRRAKNDSTWPVGHWSGIRDFRGKGISWGTEQRHLMNRGLKVGVGSLVNCAEERGIKGDGKMSENDEM